MRADAKLLLVERLNSLEKIYDDLALPPLHLLLLFITGRCCHRSPSQRLRRLQQQRTGLVPRPQRLGLRADSRQPPPQQLLTHAAGQPQVEAGCVGCAGAARCFAAGGCLGACGDALVPPGAGLEGKQHLLSPVSEVALVG